MIGVRRPWVRTESNAKQTKDFRVTLTRTILWVNISLHCELTGLTPKRKFAFPNSFMVFISLFSLHTKNLFYMKIIFHTHTKHNKWVTHLPFHFMPPAIYNMCAAMCYNGDVAKECRSNIFCLGCESTTRDGHANESCFVSHNVWTSKNSFSYTPKSIAKPNGENKIFYYVKTGLVMFYFWWQNIKLCFFFFFSGVKGWRWWRMLHYCVM